MKRTKSTLKYKIPALIFIPLITGAFNAKKAGYIIFENTLENNSALRFAYKKATGRDLEIK